MSIVSDGLLACVREGRFEDALDRIDWRREDWTAFAEPSSAILVADLLERTGRSAQARRVLNRVRKSFRLTDDDLARCSLVDGLSQKRFGRIAGAAEAFRVAQHHAERAGSAELLCWAQLRLVGTAGDLGHRQDLEDLLAALRKNVETAAVPAVTIAYHIFLAELEAKRGKLGVSRRHSQLAESLLRSFPNAWLLGLLNLQTSCLNYLEGDFLSALRNARTALSYSTESGHQSTKTIGLIDMAAAYLAAGQPARAEVCIHAGLALADEREMVYGLLLETLAETQLVGRHLAGCRESLERAERLAQSTDQTKSSWHRTWNLRTEARLLQREGRWRESLDVIRRARRKGLSEESSFAAVHIRVLEALAAIRDGSTEEAFQAVVGLLRQPSDPLQSTRGLTQAVSGSLLDKAQERFDSLDYFVRALRILGTLGETSSLVEVVDQFVGCLARRGFIPPAESVGPSPTPLWRPKELACHLDAVTSVVPFSQDRESALLGFIGGLSECSTDPSLLGEETLRLLASCGWLASGAVKRMTPEGSEVVTASYAPLTTADSSERRARRRFAPIELGSKGGSRFELVVEPADLAASALHCAEVARLLASRLGSDLAETPTVLPAGSVALPDGQDDELGLFLSPAMRALLASAKRVAPLKVTILLTGESGTGKEVIANAIHQSSGLTSAPYMPFNCATIPRDMVDSQLFGYRQGAFTGAVQPFKGVIRASEGGTLFLDEIGELPLETQPKLLRFLDCGEVQPLGEARPIRVPVRVIAATNSDLERLVSQGRFREDLFYRLNVVRFHVPPLRERRDEIRPFLERFLAKHGKEFGRDGIRLSEEAIEHLVLYGWPGNVRELSHEMRRICALHESGHLVSVNDLKPEVRSGQFFMSRGDSGDSLTLTLRIDRPLAEVTREVERSVLTLALQASDSSMESAARRLGLSRKGLYLKRRRLGLD